MDINTNNNNHNELPKDFNYEVYNKFNKELPDIHYLFNQKNKTINKKFYNNKTQKIRK